MLVDKLYYFYFQSEHIHTTETLEYQLQTVLHFEDIELSGLIDWWRKSHSRIYGYYQLSAQAYFKYLQLCDNHQVNKYNINNPITLTHTSLQL